MNIAPLRRRYVAIALIAVVFASIAWYVTTEALPQYRLFALLEAASAGNLQKAQSLVESGANVNGRFGGDGDTPLHRAAARGHTTVVNFLLSAGANPNSTNDQTSTPLLYAVANGHVETAKVLIGAGANPNIAESRFGTTPLIEATRKGNVDLVKLLVESKADRSVRDRSGETALDKAKRERNPELRSILDRAGSS